MAAIPAFVRPTREQRFWRSAEAAGQHFLESLNRVPTSGPEPKETPTMDVGTVSVKVVPDGDHEAFRQAQAETSLIVAGARMYDALYYAGPGVLSTLPDHILNAYATLGQAISNLEQ